MNVAVIVEIRRSPSDKWERLRDGEFRFEQDIASGVNRAFVTATSEPVALVSIGVQLFVRVGEKREFEGRVHDVDVTQMPTTWHVDLRDIVMRAAA